jgi:Family of unknown function (DUF5989)
LRANGSRECAPDDKLREAIHCSGKAGLLRRFAPRNDDKGNMMDFVAELWRFMRVRKKFWLLPILVMMVVFGGLVVLTKGSAIAPFIYTLF